MSNFKPGQKVVFIGGPDLDLEVNTIPEKEIVTLDRFIFFQGRNAWFVKEYPYSKLGNLLVADEKHIRPLDHQFAEDLCASLARQAIRENLIQN